MCTTSADTITHSQNDEFFLQRCSSILLKLKRAGALLPTSCARITEMGRAHGTPPPVRVRGGAEVSGFGVRERLITLTVHARQERALHVFLPN
jgi:hypothetical protein